MAVGCWVVLTALTVVSLIWSVSGQSPTCQLQSGGDCVCGVPNVHSYCGSSSCAPENRLLGGIQNPPDYCRNYFRFEDDHNLPEGWELMFDSYDYQDSVGSVFLEREFDSDAPTATVTADSWIQRGGICQRDLRVCAFELGQQDNWLFSTHIKYPPGSTTDGGGYPTEVYLNITYRFTECAPGRNCFNNFITLYRYDTNSIASETAQTNNNNYLSIPLFGQGTENTDSRFQQSGSLTNNVVRSFTTPGNTGFHLGIRDNGTCGQVGRILLYYTPCMKLQNGLVNYPELVRPPEGSPPNVGQACCAPNSHRMSTSLSFRAYSASDGRCERNVRCECDAGYRLNAAGTGCNPCPRGTYRSVNDPQDMCPPCPSNTVTGLFNASKCACIDDHFRCMDMDKKEGPEFGCTTSPGPPGPPDCPERQITGESIFINWTTPTDLGGRNDIFYYVEYQDISSTEDFISRGPVHENAYNITNLDPVIQYRIRVVSENCVSKYDTRPGIRSTRTSTTIFCTTREGISGPPSSVQVVENIVFLWQPPSNPNGIITGYRVSTTLYNTSTVTNLPMVEVNASIFWHVLRKGSIPENVTATIIVAAKTSAGYGETSSPITFEPFASAVQVVERRVTECTLEDMGLYLGLTALIAVVVTVILFLTLCFTYCICRKCKSKDTSNIKNGVPNRSYEMSTDKKIDWT